MSKVTKHVKRCAVYCRVSSDERLDQEFNSIDAQFEAGKAYVASQRAEGWTLVADRYEDPGFSGGNTERPALKRLLADIGLGRIDIVVVYKIDRLTRSLTDFSKMVEVFERHDVSFVSVTQQFNSTTSMGRLMLNVLLSFAQFEREVTGERIRDKIAAAKRKGLWMGGVPPLGYDVVDRVLVVNATEAAVIKRVFDDMLTIGSPTQIAASLNSEGITTKAWVTQEGKVREGAQIDKKVIHKLLRNRMYLGELSHCGDWHPGAHSAIIDQTLWDQVHAVLARPSAIRAGETKTRSQTDALLRGLLYTPSGERMYPTYSRKNGRQHRYYVARSESRFGAPGKTTARLPAAEIEAAVVAQIRTVLGSPEATAAVLQCLSQKGIRFDEAAVALGLSRLNDIWSQLFMAEQHRLITLMVERIDLDDSTPELSLRVTWHSIGWRALLQEFAPDSLGGELVEMETAA